ncbi:MAG: DUF6884 domain-containing protein [Candidatus Asgardarchaeia archaeon]
MRGVDWSIINEKIKECLNSTDPLSCLLRLFEETDDGWVAFKIGKILEGSNRLEEALSYYKDAYERLPLPKYKNMAKKRIEDIEKKLSVSSTVETNNKRTLFIVACTKRKIWDLSEDAPKYVPASEAYVGTTMKRWLNSKESKKYPWIIFSSKYGFIERDHPIRNYDIHFINSPGAVSEETLLRQIIYQKFDEIRISSFNKVYFVGSEDYFRKLKQVFARAGMELEKYEFL